MSNEIVNDVPNPPIKVRELTFDVRGKGLRVSPGQSIAILPPTSDPRRQGPRFYNVGKIGYNPTGDIEAISICVSSSSRPNPVASTYLHTLRKGESVDLYGPFGEIHLPPPEHDAHMLIVSTGPNVVGYLPHLTARYGDPARTGEMRVILELPTRDRSFLRDRLTAYAHEPTYTYIPLFEDEKNIEAYFSENSRSIARLLRDPKTYVYASGAIQELLIRGLRTACDKEGLDWEKIHGDMVRSGRWRIEFSKEQFELWCAQGRLLATLPDPVAVRDAVLRRRSSPRQDSSNASLAPREATALA